MSLIYYQGGKFDQRTYDMYMEVKRLTPFDIFVSQGGFNAGGVTASAGTHDRAAIDISASLLTPEERWTVCKNGRRVGFAMWIRTPAQGFDSYHLHGVPVNGDLSTAARAQVVQYLDHKNGLKGAGPDDGPTGYYDMTWEKYTGSSAYRPPINTDGTSEEDEMTPAQEAKLDALAKDVAGLRALLTWALDVTGGTGPAFGTFGELTKLLRNLDTRDKWAFDKTLGGGAAFESAGELAERIRDIHRKVSGE